MLKLVALTLVVCLVSGVPPVRRQAGLTALPAANLGALRDAGLSLLQDEVVTAGNVLLETAKHVNDTKPGCASIIESYLQGDCKLCVETKCRDKADSCSPGLWAILLGQLESFFASQIDPLLTAVNAVAVDIFHIDEVATLLSDAGAGVIDTFQDVGSVFGGLAESAANVGASIWDGATGVVGAVGDAVLGVGGSVLGGLGDLGGAVVDGFFGTIGGALQGIGDLFGGLFNRQVMVRNVVLQHHARRQARSTGEPTCAQLQNEGGTACLQYASTCGNVCDSKWLEQQYCGAFQTAMASYQAALQSHYWVSTIPPDNQNYAVNQVLIDPSAYDVAVGGYTGATATVTLFGETYTFSLDSPIVIFDMTQAGREIAQKALDLYKARHPPPTTKTIN